MPDDYKALRQPWPFKTPATDRWTWRQRKFMEWVALPKKRRPERAKTQSELAKILGVTPATLTSWKTYPGFWEEVRKEAQWLIGDSLGEIYEAMVKEAVAGSVPAAKLCLQCLGLFEEKAPTAPETFEPLVLIMNDNRSVVLEDSPIEGEYKLVDVGD